MQSFEIVGVDRESGSERKRVYRAADLDAAVRMASSDGIIVETSACSRIVEAPPAVEPALQPDKEQTVEQTVEKTLFKGNPTMFRNAPIWFVISCVLIIAYGIGALVLIIWWLRCKCSSLEVTNRRVIMRTGILSKATNEVRHQDIRNIKVNQTLQQRIFGTGNLQISTAGQSDMEIKFNGLAKPQKIADLIRSHQ